MASGDFGDREWAILNAASHKIVQSNAKLLYETTPELKKWHAKGRLLDKLKILMRSGRGGEEAASIVKKAAGSALPKATLPKTKDKTKNASPKKTKVESDNEDDSGSLSDDEEEKTIKMPAKRSSDNIKKTKEAVGNVKQMQERKEEKGLLARQTSKSATGKRDTAPKVAMRESMNEEDASSPATSAR